MKYVYLIGASIFFPLIFCEIYMIFDGANRGVYYNEESRFFLHAFITFLFTGVFIFFLKNYFKK